MNAPPPLSLTAWLRYDAISRLIPSNVVRVLEIGAGLGSVGLLLARRFEYVGLEPDSESFGTAVQRLGSTGTVVNATAEDYEAREPFDLLCAFEVLEHTEDDRATLVGWLRHLKPGGHALVSVPFRRELFSSWDEKAGHYRRYDREDIVDTFHAVGLQSVRTIAYGFPLASLSLKARNALTRSEKHDAPIEERTAASARLMQPPSWASIGTASVAAPFRVLQRPFARSNLGTGIVAVGKV